MRRLAHNQDWGYAPVLISERLYPQKWPAEIEYYPTGPARRALGSSLTLSIAATGIDVRERCLLPALSPAASSFQCDEFLGVAVEYSTAPDVQHLSVLQTMKQIAAPLLNRVGYEVPQVTRSEAVLLYLMHENRECDILLYYADHEDELLAQWQFWSQKLNLPQLIISPDGFINEQQDRMGSVLCRSAFGRVKEYGLVQRRPLFSKIRGVPKIGRQVPVSGREIMARR